MAAEDSYIFQTLKFLLDTKRPCNAEEILEYLNKWKNKRELGFRRNLRVPLTGADLEDEVLTSLESFGVVSFSKDWDSPRVWRLVASPAESNEVRRGSGIDDLERRDRDGNIPGVLDGGGGGVGGAGDGGTPGDEEGGDGLSEVLAHPVLFCLSEKDQDQLLMKALGIQPDGSHEAGGRPA